MASMFRKWPKEVTLLDPGAGVGSLAEAFADQFLDCSTARSSLHITAYEIDPMLADHLGDRLKQIAGRAQDRKIDSDAFPRGRWGRRRSDGGGIVKNER